MEDLGLTVRSITVLNALKITDVYDLYDYTLPPVGTVIQKGSYPFFPFRPKITMTKSIYDELCVLQNSVRNKVDTSIAQQMAEQMLDYPEDYGLI